MIVIAVEISTQMHTVYAPVITVLAIIKELIKNEKNMLQICLLKTR